MIIHVKQSCEFTNKDGEKFNAHNGDIVVPPEWVAHDPYFQLLTNSGLITAHIDNKSVDNQLAKEEKEKKKGK
jgi:gentisate 1,2-dioxygenase